MTPRATYQNANRIAARSCAFVLLRIIGLVTGVFVNDVIAQELPTSVPTARPVLDLRINANDADLSQVVGMVVDKSGRILVLDAKDQTVRVYAVNGTPLRNFGRKGSGPGEFEHADFMSLKRDSLWILDRSEGRLSAFSLQNNIPRTFRPMAQSKLSGQVFGVLSSGHLISVRINAPQMISGLSRFQFVRVDERGVFLNNVLGEREAVASFNLPLRIAGAPNGKPNATTRQPQSFLAKPLPVISADGQSVIAIATQESSRAFSKADVIALVSVGIRGDTLWRRSLTYKPVAITDAHFQQIIDSLSRPVAVRFGTRLAGDRRVIRDSLIRPVSWPAVTELLAGVDGTIWLKHGAPLNGPDAFWYRLSPLGVFEAMVRVPAGLNLLQASRDRLWGWRADKDDAPVVERYRY